MSTNSSTEHPQKHKRCAGCGFESRKYTKSCQLCEKTYYCEKCPQQFSPTLCCGALACHSCVECKRVDVECGSCSVNGCKVCVDLVDVRTGKDLCDKCKHWCSICHYFNTAEFMVYTSTSMICKSCETNKTRLANRLAKRAALDALVEEEDELLRQHGRTPVKKRAVTPPSDDDVNPRTTLVSIRSK